MALTGSDTSYEFPPEFINPEAKESLEYGLRYAKAIYSCGDRYGSRDYRGGFVYFDDLTDVAQGNYSTDGLRRVFGALESPGVEDPTKDFSYIDIKVLNLAPKYINRAVAKMQRLNYDVGLNAVDIVSLDEKADYAATIQAFYRLKVWIKDMGYNPQVMFPDIDIATLPEQPDELLYDISTNPKIKKEIAGELMIKLIHSINNFHKKMRQVDWDLAVYGIGHLHCYSDDNGVPRADRFHPKFYVGSYVENDDFEPQEYAGYFDFISTNQFIKETADELSQEQQMEIIHTYCNQNTHEMGGDYRRTEAYDGLGYLPVMRFYFRSEDVRTYVKKKNEYGRPILTEKKFNYRPPVNVKEKFDKGEYEKVSNHYTSIYGGTWVIDSDVVYKYKRQEYPRQQLVDATLPIKTAATNHKEGRLVSFLTQMKEPLFMINVAWTQIKLILAEGRMGVTEIDFDQIEGVAMSSGGKKWTPIDIMKLFFKKRLLIKRGKTNRHDQKIGNAIEMNTGGLQLADYMNMFSTGIQMLEQMTGASVMEQTEQPDRLAVKNAMLSQQTADVDMEYLYNAHEYLYEKTTHQLLLIAQGSLSKGNRIDGFIPALGKVNMGYYEAPKELAYCEYGIFITRQPGPEEWREFYMDVSIALKEGRLAVSDSAYLREIDNLKQARQVMAIREQIFERKTREASQQQMQMQMQMNSQSAAEALQGDIARMQEQARLDGMLIELEGRIKSQLQGEKEQWTSINKRMEHQNKRSVAKQTSDGEIIKQGLRNIPEKTRNFVNLEKVQVEREKVEVLKNKPVTAKK